MTKKFVTLTQKPFNFCNFGHPIYFEANARQFYLQNLCNPETSFILDNNPLY